MIAKIVKNTLRRFGYDTVPYPMPKWYLLRADLFEVFSSLQISCVFDVDTHGQYGSFLRNIGYPSRSLSFEPVSSSFESLSRRSLSRLNALGFSIASLVPVSRDEKLRVIEFDCLMVRG